jgi:hypothetical protein
MSDELYLRLDDWQTSIIFATDNFDTQSPSINSATVNSKFIYITSNTYTYK